MVNFLANYKVDTSANTLLIIKWSLCVVTNINVLLFLHLYFSFFFCIIRKLILLLFVTACATLYFFIKLVSKPFPNSISNCNFQQNSKIPCYN